MGFFKRLFHGSVTRPSTPAASNGGWSWVPYKNGTLLDIKSGLTWQRAPEERAFTWLEAKKYAQQLRLAGHSDWRLPSRDELCSLRDSILDPDLSEIGPEFMQKYQSSNQQEKRNISARFTGQIREIFFSGYSVGDYWSSTASESLGGAKAHGVSLFNPVVALHG